MAVWAWILSIPRFGDGRVTDWPGLGLTSSKMQDVAPSVTKSAGMSHRLRSQSDSLAHPIDFENAYVNPISNLHDIVRVLHEVIRQLRYVDKSVLVDADVNECAKRGHVGHDAVDLHARCEVVDSSYVISERWRFVRRARISAGLFELSANII
jgi:hypothetical protein